MKKLPAGVVAETLARAAQTRAVDLRHYEDFLTGFVIGHKPRLGRSGRRHRRAGRGAPGHEDDKYHIGEVRTGSLETFCLTLGE